MRAPPAVVIPPPPVSSGAVEARGPLEGSAVPIFDAERTAAPTYAWSPDGLRLAVTETNQVVRIWDVARAAIVATTYSPGDALSLRFTPDGATLLVVAARGAAAFRAADGTCDRFVPAVSLERARRAAFTASGRTVATLDVAGGLRAFDVATGTLRWRAEAGELATFDPQVVAEDRLVTLAGGRARVFAAADGKPLPDLPRPPAADWTSSTSPDARAVAFLSPDRTRVLLVDVDTGKQRLDFRPRGKVAYASAMVPQEQRPRPGQGSAAEVHGLAWSPDGRSLALVFDPPNSTFELLGRAYLGALVDVATGRLRPLRGPVSQGGGFSGDGKRYVSTGPSEGSPPPIAVFDVATGERHVGAHDADLTNGVANLDGGLVAHAPGSTVRVVDVASGATKLDVPAWSFASWPSSPFDDRPVLDVAFERGGERIAIAGAIGAVPSPPSPHGTLSIWNPVRGTARTTSTGGGSALRALWPARGSWIASLQEGEPRYRVRLARRDLDTLAETWSIEVEKRSAEIAPDGATVAARTREAILLLRASDGVELFRFDNESINATSYDPTGARLAVRDYYRKRVDVFDVASGARLAEVAGRDAFFAPTGVLVVHAGDRLVIHDAKTGAELRAFPAPKDRHIAARPPDGALALFQDGTLMETETGVVRAHLPPTKRSNTWETRPPDRLFSPDGELLALDGAETGVIDVVDTRDGARVARFLVPDRFFLGAFSPDHASLALLGPAGVELVRLADGATLDLGLVATDTEPAHAEWLGSGHFRGDPQALDHLRLWTPTRGAPASARPAFRADDIGARFTVRPAP